MKPKKIVITGGPATGKTTIIEDLNLKGYFCYEEVIRKLTAEAQDSGDITETHSNPIALVSDAAAFNSALINLRIEDFKAADALKTAISFFDRGMPDVLAYMSYFNQSISDHFIDLCHTHRYDYVFILPPWEAIYKDDGERFETFEQASDIYHKLIETYHQFGYASVEVPFGSIETRTNFIIEHLNL